MGQRLLLGHLFWFSSTPSPQLTPAFPREIGSDNAGKESNDASVESQKTGPGDYAIPIEGLLCAVVMREPLAPTQSDTHTPRARQLQHCCSRTPSAQRHPRTPRKRVKYFSIFLAAETSSITEPKATKHQNTSGSVQF